jgi:AcrR family transcriptional regulator
MTLKSHATSAVPQGIATRQTNPTARLIIDATEQLCAEQGIEAVSIRDIARAADVSISVIYHHFGSRAKLLRALLSERLEEISADSADIMEQMLGKGELSLREILYCIYAPLARMRARGRTDTVQFLAQALVTPLTEMTDVADEGAAQLSSLIDLLEKLLPDLSRQDICWRLHFAIGIRHMTHHDYARLSLMSGGLCDSAECEESIQRAIDFAEAGLRAPPYKFEPIR